MSSIIPFSYQEKEIRVIEDQDGTTWWVAKDVCDALGIKNPTQAIEFLDDDERSMFNIGRQGDVNIISESGLYGLIGKSRKEEAKQFQRWVRKDVLPSIRKTGKYETQGKKSNAIKAPSRSKVAQDLAYCKQLGYHWDGLYDVFDRVSCFCCPKGGKTKRRLILENFPELEKEWQRLDVVAGC